MIEKLRKVFFLLALPALLVLIAFNAYVAIKGLERIRETTTMRLESSQIQADIASVLLDLVDMETGQRGYLLTGNPAYLQPYNDASTRLPNHLAELRNKLAGRAQEERNLLAQTEALAKSKAAEIAETINFRQKGYRHRAFLIVDSNEGKQYMDQARGSLAALAKAEDSGFAKHAHDMDDSLQKARKDCIVANLTLLLLTALLYSLFARYTRRIESDVSQRTEALRKSNTHVKDLTSAIDQGFRDRISEMKGHADAMLTEYGDFLPRRGTDLAERIKGLAGEMGQATEEILR